MEDGGGGGGCLTPPPVQERQKSPVSIGLKHGSYKIKKGVYFNGRVMIIHSFLYKYVKFGGEAQKYFNILRISTSNILKMFLNIIFSVGRAVVIFCSYKPTGSTNQPEVQTNRKYKPTGSTNTLC